MAEQFTSSSVTAAIAKPGVTLVDFYADWCGPCRMVAPVIVDLAQAYAGKAVIGKLNVDEAGDIAQQYGVQSIPTLIFFKDGTEAKRVVGAQPKEALQQILDALL